MPRNFDPQAKAFQTRPRADDAQKPVLQAKKVDRLSKEAGSVTYTVIDAPAKAKGQDRRNPPRKRTRLRCGKILDKNGKFLIECQVYDRSSQGAQLRLMGAAILPHHIKFFDDEQKTLIDAEIIWRKNGEIGIQFWSAMNARAILEGRRSALDGKYYAVS